MAAADCYRCGEMLNLMVLQESSTVKPTCEYRDFDIILPRFSPIVSASAAPIELQHVTSALHRSMLRADRW